MSSEFHDRPFDKQTRLKLRIFGNYLREWIPVFLMQSRRRILICDFFSGPGADSMGTPGTPLIISAEMKACFRLPKFGSLAKERIRIVFNDSDEQKVTQLERTLANDEIHQCARVQLYHEEFESIFPRFVPELQKRDVGALVIIDQFGMKCLTPEVFQVLVRCPSTDILFFLSSSTIRRFAEDPVIRKYMPVDADEIRNVPHTDAHRFLCRKYFRSLVPQGVNYYLAPFSLLQDNPANVYGIIFGSSSYYGLEKFLTACWKADPWGGEANFGINSDFFPTKDELPFHEVEKPKKMEDFEEGLVDLIRKGGATNCTVYEFTLEQGFLPKHARALLAALQKQNRLDVLTPEGAPASRKGFYIGWREYKTKRAKVHFRLKDGA